MKQMTAILLIIVSIPLVLGVALPRGRVHAPDTASALDAAVPNSVVRAAPPSRLDYLRPGPASTPAPPPGSVTRLTNDPAQDSEAVWSSDGERIAFISNRDGDFDIYVMDADGGNLGRLTNDTFNNGGPTWGPDDWYMAFHSDHEGDGTDEIYTMNSDGSNQAMMPGSAGDNGYPAWSPDGWHIAFHSNRDGNWEIYVATYDGSEITRLTNDPAHDFSPTWSPDGKKLVFTSNRGGSYDLYVVDSDGQNLTRLTTDDTTDEVQPAWSASGWKIAFGLKQGDTRQIYAMNADGTGQVKLTDGPYDTMPDWSPDDSRLAFTHREDTNGDGVVNVQDAGDIYVFEAPLAWLAPFEGRPLEEMKAEALDLARRSWQKISLYLPPMFMSAGSGSRGDYLKATELLTQVLQQNPHDAEALAYRGWSLSTAGHVHKGFADCDRANELDPSQAWSLRCRSQAYWQLSLDYTDYAGLALADAGQAIELAPSDAVLYRWRSYLYMLSSSTGIDMDRSTAFTLAEADLSQALTLEPQNGEGYFLRAVFYAYHPDNDRSQAWLDTTVNACRETLNTGWYPSDSPNHWALQTCLESNGNYLAEGLGGGGEESTPEPLPMRPPRPTFTPTPE
jgi:hypothetical protein